MVEIENKVLNSCIRNKLLLFLHYDNKQQVNNLIVKIMTTAKDFMVNAKKQNSTILKARLKSGKFESPEEKEAYLEVLKLRGMDVSSFEKPLEVIETPTETAKEVEIPEVPEEIDSASLNDAADDAYEAICLENNQTKVKALADLLARGDGTTKDWEEITDEEKKGILEISKMVVVETKKDATGSVKKEKTEDLVPFTEEQKVIFEKTELTKAERTRQLFDSGCSVKQIAKNTGWDYVNAYDTIKAYNKKKEKEAEK